MNISRCYCFIILLFVGHVLQAQSPVFKHFSNKEGLVQSPVSSILQDRTGYIWLGTQKGLIRYDGYEFKAFHPERNNSNTISNNRVNVVFQDSDHRIWIGTSNGLNLFDQAQEAFRRIDIQNIKGGRNYIASITEDNHKNIWVGTFGGLKKLNKKTLKFEDLPGDHVNPQFKDSPVFSLLVDHNNIIWAGTRAGLMKFDPEKQKTDPLPEAFSKDKKFSDNRILVIKQDQHHDIYFGTEISGVFKFSPRDNSIKNYHYQPGKNSVASNWVKDILITKNNGLWFATRNGISSLDSKSQIFTNYKHDPLNVNSLNENSIWSLMEDRNNCIWIGTFAGGLNFYYKGNSNFQNIGEKVNRSVGLKNVRVNTITKDPDGSFWVGTAGGLTHIDRNANADTNFNLQIRNNTQPANAVKSLADDGRGNLWVGTLDGVGMFNKKTGNLKYINLKAPNSKLSENLISCILADGDGAWVGTNGGGLRYTLPNGVSGIVLTKDQANSSGALTDNYITALLKDGEQYLWIGTQNGLNLYAIKEKRLIRAYRKTENDPYQIPNSNISALFKDSKKRLWVGTEEGGLNYFDVNTQRFYTIDKKQGLADNVVRAIAEDNRNNIWVSTDLGVSDIKFKKFSVPFKKRDLNITSYTVNDGLISNQFANQAGLRLGSGEIIFGGINGLTLFQPSKITLNTIPPPVVITALLVNNRPQKSWSNGFRLNHDQSNLSIRFAALNFINPYNNRYAYKLEGFTRENTWEYTGHQRVVNFTRLQPGYYILRVKAANNDGVWGKEAAPLVIHILPPLWLTWWAYIIYLVLVAAIVYTIFVFLQNRERLKRDLYLEHAHSERLNELYEMKLNFFTNVSHELRTPLTLILGPLERLILEHQDADFSKALRLIKVNADRLLRLVTELLDFRKAEEGHLRIYVKRQDIVSFCHKIYKSFSSLAASKHIGYNFSTTTTGPQLIYFDENQFDKVIFNLLSNAFKFTEDGGRISMEIGYSLSDAQWIEITVTDNGIGIPEDFRDKLFETFSQADVKSGKPIGSGIGLAMAKNIVELHKGQIKADSLENGQTRFTVSLQTGTAHFSPTEIFSQMLTSEPAADEIAAVVTEDQVFAASGYFGNKKYKLMVVEDNDDVRELIIDSLKSGYNIVNCANGQIAMDLLEQEMPDLIISDIMMPGINGIQLCQNVKSSESTNHIPFILLTAKAAVEHQLEGLGIGADAYLSKPFSIQLLQLNIRNLLRAQEVVRAKFGKSILLSPVDIDTVTPEEKFISKLMQIIESRMDDASFDVLDLVKEIGMSRSVLYKKVQSLTNFAVADLIKERRLIRAAQLLTETSFNISEITYMVGFTDRKYFSKEFKKKYMVTPSAFVRENKVEDG